MFQPLVKFYNAFQQDTSHYARLLGYLKPYRTRFISGILTSIPAASLNGLVAYLSGPLVDSLIKKQDYTLLTLIPLGVVAASAIQAACDYASQYQSSYVGTAISRDLRHELFQKLITQDLRYFKTHTSGELMTRYYQDPYSLQQAIVTNLQTFLLECFSAIFLVSVLLSQNIGLAALSLVIISLIWYPLSVISKKTRRLDHEGAQILAALYNVFHESVVGAKIMMAFHLRDYQHQRFMRRLTDYFGNAMRLNRAGLILKPIMQVIASVGVAAILWIGGRDVQQGLMTPGSLTSFLLALVLLYKPVKNIGTIASKVQRIMAPAERVFEKLDLQPQVASPLNSPKVDGFQSLSLDGVSFHYGAPQSSNLLAQDTEQSWILRDVSLDLYAGDVLALVGPSGGGKSTLVDLLPRFMDPQSGLVRLNGQDIRSYDVDSVRGLFAIVTQDTQLFDGTIRDNILMGRPDLVRADAATVETLLEQAIEMAHLAPVLAELPEGLETVIGELGTKLSGGQRQRVAIVRAFIKQAPVLILDEATSALDNIAEAQVQQAMERLMQGKTVIVIAHRLSTVQHAHRIAVVNQGRIEAIGPHDTLMGTSPLYHQLVTLQFQRLQPDTPSPLMATTHPSLA